MNKRYAHHVWRYFRKVRPWYFLGLAIVCGVICLVALRHNNEQMIKLRDAVYTADKNGGDVEGALHDLRKYVYSHMNTSLSAGSHAVYPPIQLKFTYERLQEARAKDLAINNRQIYHAAEESCNRSVGENALAQEKINCIDNYVSQRGISLRPIPDALYKFDFVAARWSPDLAGWSLVTAILLFVVFLVSAAYHWWAKKYLL